MCLPRQECACVSALAEAACVSRDPPAGGRRESLNIGHLTDVSHCKLHQYLCCNREIKCQLGGRSDLPGAGRAG